MKSSYPNIRILLWVVMAVFLASLSGCRFAGATTGTPRPPLVPDTSPSSIPPVSTINPASSPPEIIQYSKDWPLPNKDYANTRNSKDSSINSGNVQTLGVAWALPLSGTPKGNPLITDNAIYYQDFMSNVYAVDLYGNLKWQKNYNTPTQGPNGVAVGWKKIFATADNNRVVALDIDSGQELWSRQILGNQDDFLNIQPSVFGEMVLISTSSAGITQATVGQGIIGTVYALDERTGDIKWSFNTADSKDIWGNPAINGGGGCYFPPAVDTSTGITYWGTDAPAPFPGSFPGTTNAPAPQQFPNGSSRPGDNLYTNTMLALEIMNGKLNWYKQVIPHDLFGRSLTCSPILTRASIGGQDQDIVIGSGKVGKVYVFNRQSGAILWERSVGKHENDQLTELPTGTTQVYPSGDGGVEMPMALAEGVLYIAVNNMYADFTPLEYTPQSILEASSDLIALNVNNGEIFWDQHFNSLSTSPPTVVNDVVFSGTLDGKIHALATLTGRELWTYQGSPDTSTGWAAVSNDTVSFSANVNGISSLIVFKLGAHQPRINVVSPVNDSWMVPGSNVTVDAEVFNFKITDNMASPNSPREGHLIYYLNVDPPTTPGKPALTDPGTYVISNSTSYTWSHLPMVPDGGYGFSVQLVNNDNTPLEPAAVSITSLNIIGFHPD